MTLRMAIACCLLIASAHRASLAQPPVSPPEAKIDPQERPLRLNAELIQVRAVVKDRAGRVVTDLNKEDFELLDNNHSQPISFFALERIGDEHSTSATPARIGKEARPDNALPPARPQERSYCSPIRCIFQKPACQASRTR